MLKTFIMLGAIIAPNIISARSLSVDEAKQIATNFLQQKRNSFQQSRSATSDFPKLTLSTQEGKTSRSTTPAYYIFNVSDNNGYVIVSGDDRFNKVLGYSENGNYLPDKPNPSAEFWLNHLAEEMANVQDKNERNSHTTITLTEVKPLLNTKWNQDEPYNNECWVSYLRPTIGQKPQHAPTGCVATAMAQIMNYHKWPQTYQDFEYNWDIMLPSYDGNESAESINQVAQLMKHCGQAVNTNYGASASSASPYSIVPALVNQFGYDGAKIQTLEYRSFGKEYIHTFLNNELKEGRPVIVGGDYPSQMGHEFIFDGCTPDGFFHVNWGWGGYLDGYYRITSLRPEDFGTGGIQEGYSFNVSIIAGIQPKKNLDENTPLRAKIAALGDLCWLKKEGCDTVTTSYQTYLEPTFSTENGLIHNGFINIGTTSFSGYNDLIHTKWTNLATGEFSIKGNKYFVRGIAPGYYSDEISFFNNAIRISLLPGEKYEVSLVYHLAEDEKGVFHDVEFGVGRRSSIIVERFGDSLRCIYPKTPVLLKAELPVLSDRMQIKSGHTFSSTFTNTSTSQEYIGEAKCMFINSEGQTVSNLTEYVMLDLMPGENVTENFTLYKLGNATPGIYTVGLYDFRNNLISDTKTVELYEHVVTLDEINFPDSIFRNYISSKYDLDNDGQLSSSELNSATAIQVKNLGITDFKGCELLPNLSFVEIINEKCTTIDLSTSGPFNYLSIYDTPLETITLGKRKELTYCYIHDTNLKELDLSGCPNVLHINAANNKLERLLIHGLSKLQTLSCYGNNLTELDLAGITNLTKLFCSSNHLTELNLTGLSKLNYLDAVKNNLSGKLDLSELKELEKLVIWENKLSELILGEHPNLKAIDIDNNKLSGKLDISGYTSLESCRAQQNSFDEFIAGNNKVITELWLSYNQLKESLDVTAMENLETLYADNNNLEEIVIKNNDKLKVICLNNNKLIGKINVSSFNELTSISADGNELSELVIGKHPNLRVVSAYGNKIEGTLDLSNCPAIKFIYLSRNQLQKVILANNPELETLEINDNQYISGTLDISGSPNLKYLNASGNKISTFKYGLHPNLTSLHISDNCLTHFHLEDFTSLNSYSYGKQEADIIIGTPNFNLKTLSSTDFDPKRASEWWIYWNDGTESKYQEGSTINDVLLIPEEAGRDITLEYNYLTDVTSNRKTNFTINLTREGFTAIDDIIADSTDKITVEGNIIHTATNCMKEIFNISGQCIYRGTDELISIDSGHGIYLIRIAGKTIKIAI